jgi:N-acetylated-alpha-linked acidic dipeptidase
LSSAGRGTQYHSIYDDFYWHTHFVDKEFVYGRALSQTAGTAIMRRADADLIPLDYAPQGLAIAICAAELEQLLKDKQEEFAERNLEIQEGVFEATLDPRNPSAPPPAGAVPPYVNLAALKTAIAVLKSSADRYSHAFASFEGMGSPSLSAQSLALINADLLRVSRLFLNQKSLPERAWFKNQIYAPGVYTGYGAKPIAAVHEYMDEQRWREAEAQVPQVAQAIESAAAGIEKAAEDFENEMARGR